MHTFETPQPVLLHLRSGSGTVTVSATDDPVTTVTLTALNDAALEAVEQAKVLHDRDRVLVDVPRRGGFLRSGPRVAIEVALPAGSRLEVATESADITAKGSFGDTQLVTGSGDLDVDHVDGRAELKTGSGRVSVGTVTAGLAIKTGSGDVNVDRTARRTQVNLGSGDISLGEVVGEVVTKSGSGDLEVGILAGDLTAKTGSGDLTVRRATSGSVRSSGASGDISIGVAEGTAAWLDLSTVTGTVVQELAGSTGPGEGQQQVEVTAHTVSGDVRVYRP